MNKKLLAGMYEVLDRVGSSSLGSIYRCRHKDLGGQEVFVNVLFDELAADQGASSAVREVILRMQEVHHPNFITVYEYLRDDELTLFSTEAVPGMLLSDFIEENAPVSQERVIEIILGVLGALEAIHRAGIVHRSLMPEGVVIREDGSAMLISLPVPNLLVTPALTEDNQADGYLDCAAPECIEVGELDFRSDVYALGVIAYELITGSRPFNGKSIVDSLTMRLENAPIPPSKLRSDCLPELCEVTMRALSRYPDDRYQTAKEMREDLERRVVARH